MDRCVNKSDLPARPLSSSLARVVGLSKARVMAFGVGAYTQGMLRVLQVYLSFDAANDSAGFESIIDLPGGLESDELNGK